MDSDKPTRGSKKRELIRRSAYQCFRDNGYHETTVDAICEAAMLVPAKSIVRSCTNGRIFAG